MFRIGKRPFDRIAIVEAGTEPPHDAKTKFWAGFFQKRSASRNSVHEDAFIQRKFAVIDDTDAFPVHCIATLSPCWVTRGPWIDSLIVTVRSRAPRTTILSGRTEKFPHRPRYQYWSGFAGFTVSR